jgi:hypothetical protein
MTRILASAVSAFALSAVIAAPALAADTQRDGDHQLGDTVPLDQGDLQSITAQVMQKYSLLSSAPGIKFAHAQRSVRSIDIASVIFLPHTESSGVKQAFQVRCVRQMPETRWSCEEPEIRRYLRLGSQDFEVRVSAGISNDGALALIEASRRFTEATSSVYQTAIQVSTDGDGSLVVSWGTPEGSKELLMRARLRAGADESQPESWQISPFELETL